MKKVKRCFGRYGDKELESYPYLKSNEKPKLRCIMMCQDFPKCRDCYYLWWKHRRPRETELKEVIRKFMRSSHMEFRE